MNIFTKLLWRRPAFSAIIVLLMVSATAFLLLGSGTWQATNRQLDSVGNQYTTTVLPYNQEKWGKMPEEEGSTVFEPKLVDLDTLAEGAPVETTVDHRVVLGAFIDGTRSATYQRTEETGGYDDSAYIERDDPYLMSVFAVRCDEVKVVSSMEESRFDENGKQIGTVLLQQYDYKFTVLETICRADWEYDLPQKLYASYSFVGSASGPAFEEGSTYLLRGRCSMPQSGELQSLFTIVDGAADDGLKVSYGEKYAYCEPRDDVFPMYAEYYGELDAFFDTEKGKVWAEAVIPSVQKIYSTSKLVLTDQVDSIFQFNDGSATLVEGRKFTPDEYQSGASVCLISQEFAAKNNLKIGDALNMDLYHPEITFQESFPSIDGTLHETDCQFEMNPCYPQNDLDMTRNYTIVGIYTATPTYMGVFTFTPDMIFAPRASVPNVSTYEEDSAAIPFLNSMIIENGAIQQFESYLEEQGWGGSFLYSDQGYTEMSQSVQATIDNALRLFCAAVVVFLAVLCACVLLVASRIKVSLVTMRMLGVSQRHCWRNLDLAFVPVWLLALLGGTVICWILFERICALLLASAWEFRFQDLLPCVLVLCVLYLALMAAAWGKLKEMNIMNQKR